MVYVVEHVSNDEFNAEMVCKDEKFMFFHTPNMYITCFTQLKKFG